jgi:hypothetical protein
MGGYTLTDGTKVEKIKGGGGQPDYVLTTKPDGSQTGFLEGKSEDDFKSPWDDEEYQVQVDSDFIRDTGYGATEADIAHRYISDEYGINEKYGGDFWSNDEAAAESQYVTSNWRQVNGSLRNDPGFMDELADDAVYFDSIDEMYDMAQNDSGADLFTQYADSPDGFEFDYYGGGGLSDEALQYQIAQLDSSIEQTSNITEDFTTYRGGRLDNVDKNNPAASLGATFTDEGFVSTSTTKEFADNWVKHGVGTDPNRHYTIATKVQGSYTDTQGRYLPAYHPGMQHNQPEFLLPRGLSFDVVGFSFDADGLLTIYTETY